MPELHPGTLFIIATPLGNLQDMSFRAVATLQSVHLIAAEDTRHSLPLLQYFSIKTPVLSLHDHNEEERIPYLLKKCQQGESIALISDAGTPLISDPGFLLVKSAREQGIPVQPVPGPCALIAALSVAGLPTHRFVFEGFLPKKKQARLQQLHSLMREERTLVFYESPHRIVDCLQECVEVFGKDRLLVVARELTKHYETILSGTTESVLQQVMEDRDQQRGELVVLVKGYEPTAHVEDHRELLTLLLAELPLKKAVDLAARLSQARKNDLYQYALELKKHS